VPFGTQGEEALTGLGNGDQVVTALDCGNAIFLNWRRGAILAEFDITKSGRMQSCVLKPHHRGDASWALLEDLDFGNPGSCQCLDRGEGSPMTYLLKSIPCDSSRSAGLPNNWISSSGNSGPISPWMPSHS